MDEIKGVPELDTNLLPTYQKYRQENTSWIPGFDLWDYLNLRQADFDLTAAFSKLFWPDFVEVDGCVLLARSYSTDNFARWMAQFAGDTRAVEAMLNHTHIHDLYPGIRDGPDASLELLEYLAQIFLVSWRHALLEGFPEKRFVFSYLTQPEVPSPEISFYQAG
ncbi:MAG: hypothetical protein ACR2M0_05745 [Chloroflexia bacterium]